MKFIVAILLLLFSSVSAAQSLVTGKGGFDNGNPRVEAELLLDVDSVSADSVFTSAIHIRIDPGWYIYWRNSGEAGFPTTAEFNSDSASFDAVSYPVPEFIKNANDPAIIYGYRDETLLFSEASANNEVNGTIVVNASVSFLVCKVICIPGQIDLLSEIPVVTKATSTSQINQTLYNKYKILTPALPRSIGLTVQAHLPSSGVIPGVPFELGLTLSTCQHSDTTCPDTVDFVPSTNLAALDLPDSLQLDVVGLLPVKSANNRTILAFKGMVLPGMEVSAEFSIVMQVVIDGAMVPIRASIALSGVPFSKDATIPTKDLDELFTKESKITFWLAIAFGLIGGLILNFMPCVLPILALKTLRVVESGVNKKVRDEKIVAASYLTGVLMSMLALAGLVIVLKLIGEQVGWGFQFQHPSFLVFMASFLTLFALNLFGIFDINVSLNAFSQTRSITNPVAVSFVDGALMVLLATPCTAPFMGTAVGFAFAGDSVTTIAIFASIGVGLSIPYCALLLVPQLRQRLPKPGEWMIHLRSVMGFFLLATVLWIVWVSGSSSGVDGVARLLGTLLFLSFITWCIGIYQKKAAHHQWLVSTMFVAAIIAGIYSTTYVAARADQRTRSNNVATWEPNKIQSLLADGKPVFVNFTADWCLTCKINERVVLSNESIIAEMDKLGIMRLEADWTQRNDLIRQELQAHGKAGVPLYLLYSVQMPEAPIILPELLTPNIVRQALEKLVKPSG